MVVMVVVVVVVVVMELDGESGRTGGAPVVLWLCGIIVVVVRSFCSVQG